MELMQNPASASFFFHSFVYLQLNERCIVRSVVILVVLLGLSPITFSADIFVPDDYTKIQDAINAALDGDTIIVRPGTYVENINFSGKAITVQSEQGTAVTTIDGNQAGSVVTFQSGEGTGTYRSCLTPTSKVIPAQVFLPSLTSALTSSTPYGDFWLMPPWNHRVHFNAMPDNGVRLIDRGISAGLPPGTQIPLQALVGTELSNLWVVEVE